MAKVYTTLDPAAKAASITLSDGDLTATHDGVNWGIARATFGKGSGKWYWEVWNTDSSNQDYIGVCNASCDVSNGNFLGIDNNSWSAFMPYGTVKEHGGVSESYSTWEFHPEKVVGVCLDMDAGTLSFYRDNIDQGVAYSGITGVIFPAISGVSGSTHVNFGATPMTFTAPAGYNQGFYNESGSTAGLFFMID